MGDFIRVEQPISNSSRLLSIYKTIGDIRQNYHDKLKIVKYIYVDSNDNNIKGTNPSDDLPILSGAYITVIGVIDDVIQFTEDATYR